MGRYSFSDRKTVEECKALSILRLNEWGYLCGFQRGTIEWKNALGEVTSSIGIEVSVNREGYGEDYVRVIYTEANRLTEEKKDLDYKIQLVTTPCHFGGVRFWFICPLGTNQGYCGRRVGKLYLPRNATYFGCRHCYNLTYESCKEHDSRVSGLMKLPPGQLEKLLKSKDPKTTLLAAKAALKFFDKFKLFP